jgi:Arc/MetJ-type ribon-helix-helix transcriptional regulator
MATVKITVTVPEDLAGYIREQVARGAYESVSAFVTRAAESTRDLEPLDLLIASMVAETGEPDQQARSWAEAAVAVAAARRALPNASAGDGGRAA